MTPMLLDEKFCAPTEGGLECDISAVGGPRLRLWPWAQGAQVEEWRKGCWKNASHEVMRQLRLCSRFYGPGHQVRLWMKKGMPPGLWVALKQIGEYQAVAVQLTASSEPGRALLLDSPPLFYRLMLDHLGRSAGLKKFEALASQDRIALLRGYWKGAEEAHLAFVNRVRVTGGHTRMTIERLFAPSMQHLVEPATHVRKIRGENLLQYPSLPFHSVRNHPAFLERALSRPFSGQAKHTHWRRPARRGPALHEYLEGYAALANAITNLHKRLGLEPNTLYQCRTLSEMRRLRKRLQAEADRRVRVSLYATI